MVIVNSVQSKECHKFYSMLPQTSWFRYLSKKWRNENDNAIMAPLFARLYLLVENVALVVEIVAEIV